MNADPQDGLKIEQKTPEARASTPVGTRIRSRRREIGLSLSALARRSGCSKAYLSMLENGERAGQVGAAILVRLESALEMAAGELARLEEWARTPESIRLELERLRAAANGAEAPSGAGPGEIISAMKGAKLDELYKSGALRRLVTRVDGGAGERGGAERVSDGVLRLGTVERAMPVEVPLINKVAAGYPREFTDLGYPARVADEHVRVAAVGDADAFAARVVGDSMSPEYREGDIVVFSPTKAASSGSDCFVRLDRDAQTTFKRVFFEGRDGASIEVGPRGEEGEKVEWIRLVALNAAYGERRVHREEVAGLYPAVSVTRGIGENAGSWDRGNMGSRKGLNRSTSH